MATLWRGVRRCVSQRSRNPATYQLYLVTDDAFLDDQFYYKVEAAIRGGVTCLQLRLKNVSTSVYVSWAQKMRQLTQQHHIPLIVDDRLDVALAVEADGLHVGGDDLPWRTARRLLGSHRILGCSTYGRPELVSAALHPEVNADYLGSGAIFTTPTKASQAKGMEHLPLLRKQVASEGPVPIVAIGGVDLSSAADCVRSGADGVAVVRGILQSSGPEDSEAKAKALLAEVRSALEDRENEKVQPRTILDETDELGKSVDKDVSILIENKPLEKPKKEVQAQTACAAVEKDAKDLKAPEPKVEPSKDAGLPSLNDLPSKSQDALRPLLQRYGEARHKEVFALHTFLGDGQARSSCLRRRCGCALHVWGPAGVGKTEVVTGYLKELGHKYIFLNCYCILSQADLHRKLVMGTMRLAEEAQRAADSKLERFESKLPQQLRAIDRLEAALKAPIAELRRLECSQVLLVLDHVEELIGRIGLPAFELVLALPEVLSYGDMLVPITISRVPLKSLGLRSTREPPHVGFEPYSDSNTLQLLLRHFTKKGGRDIETLNFVIYGLQKMAVPFVGWNLGLLIEVVEMVLDAMPAGAKHDAAVLQPLIEEACRRRVGFVHKPMKDPEAKLIKVSQTMSKAEMRLVLAAYLASRVCKQDDRQLFLGRSTRRKRAVMVRQKDNALPAHVKQPNVVTIPRLLATYHHLARQPRLIGSNIFQALTKLKEAGLVRFVGEKNFKMDKDLKVVCRAELPLAQACAATLNVDLTEYLCK